MNATKPKSDALRDGWARWNRTIKRITAHRNYTWESWNNGNANRLALLLKLARFAQTELGHYNTAYWKGQTCRLP